MTAALSPFARVASFYDGLVTQYGHDPRACDYGRAESQAIKFKVLSEVMDLSGQRVLDVGCGFADYADFLAMRAAGVQYTGTDISPSMIREARRLRPTLDLHHLNILDHAPPGPFDVVTANGIFYLLGDDAELLMQRLIREMFVLARTAVAFNSLSAWAPAKDAGEFYADPLETLRFCRELTPRVVCRHDYHDRDFTIYLYRQSQS
jgi:SAM-dependent methyltransferase